jgi:hypothetical protein
VLPGPKTDEVAGGFTMSTSLLDVLVGQRVRLIVSKEYGDPAKGEERSRREVETVGQLLDLPDSPLQRARMFEDHYVHSADGKRQVIQNEDVRRIEVLDPASDDVLLFAKCTAEPSERWTLGLDHRGAQCCVHEVHVGEGQERQQPGGRR